MNYDFSTLSELEARTVKSVFFLGFIRDQPGIIQQRKTTRETLENLCKSRWLIYDPLSKPRCYRMTRTAADFMVDYHKMTGSRTY